jgi:hypothetical protein
MADRKSQGERDATGGGDSPSKTGSTGDPGRTPGKAEGDRSAVEEDLRDKERQGR